MKRFSTSAEPDNGRAKAARRQDIVSCEFCRKKKLKCDRAGILCSNCRARKLVCSLGNDATQTSLVPVVGSEIVSSSQSLDDLNSRVKRLEELLSPKSDLKNSGQNIEALQPTFSAIVSARPNGASEEGGELCRTVSSMETDDFEHVPPPCDRNTTREFGENILADNFGSFFFSLSRPRISLSLQSNLASLLPPRKQGEALLNYYFENIDWVYRIVHVPTVKQIFHDLYTKFENGQRLPYGHLAFMSTIFASSAFFCSSSSKLFYDRDDAVAHSRRLSLLAQDALTAANCLSQPTIETLQSLIILTQWLMPNIGAIATLRTLSSTLMHTARSMGLHLTDSPENKRWRVQNQVDWIEVEVKRRIWWHITSTDWLLSFMGVAQNGTYMVHPKHMNVDYPSNVNDIGITPNGDYAQPDDVATEMTFFRFRCRGTTLFREVVDAAWEAGSELEDLPYETVLHFDKKFKDITLEFDGVFDKYRNALTVVQTSDPRLNTKSPPNVHWAMVHFCMDSRFARLHRPYLVRGAKDPKYAYSRMVCLRSARSLMELGNIILETSKNLVAFKLWAIKHHMYVATIILVMDYCFNRNEPRAKERREEILEYFRAVKRNDNGCTTMPPGLQKLEEILRDATDTNGSSANNSTYSDSWKATEVDAPKRLPQIYKDSAANLVDQPAANTVLTVHTPTLLAGGNNFTDAMSQQPWIDFDFNSWDNTDFNSNLDTSLFDELFQNLENNNDLI